MTTLAHLVAELADRIGVTHPDEVRERGARISTPPERRPQSMTRDAIYSRNRRARLRAEREQDAA